MVDREALQWVAAAAVVVVRRRQAATALDPTSTDLAHALHLAHRHRQDRVEAEAATAADRPTRVRRDRAPSRRPDAAVAQATTAEAADEAYRARRRPEEEDTDEREAFTLPLGYNNL